MSEVELAAIGAEVTGGAFLFINSLLFNGSCTKLELSYHHSLLKRGCLFDCPDAGNIGTRFLIGYRCQLVGQCITACLDISVCLEVNVMMYRLRAVGGSFKKFHGGNGLRCCLGAGQH